MVKQWAAGFLGMLLSAATAMAQALTVPTSISSGDTISIAYHDQARAGQTITVRIDQVGLESSEIEVFIHLDQDGRGTVSWTVPDLISVAFNAPGVRQITRAL